MDIFSLQKRFPDDEAFIAFYVSRRYPDGVTCRHCGNGSVCKVTSKKYYCNRCKNSFSVFTESIFRDTKLPFIKWIYAINRVAGNSRKGISSCELAREVGVRQATAWRMLTKIRERMVELNDLNKLCFIVEADETYVGGKPRKANCKWANIKESNKTAVITIVERPTKDCPVCCMSPNS